MAIRTSIRAAEGGPAEETSFTRAAWMRPASASRH